MKKNGFRRTADLLRILISSVLLVCMLSGCALTDFLFEENETSAADTSVPVSDPEVPDVTTSPETRADETSAPEGTETSAVSTDTQTGTEDTSPATPDAKYTDPLTGLELDTDYTRVRPVCISIDNLSAAAPQSGVSRADILIECMVESGISRLMMITNKYEGNEVYGPVRSVRDYMVYLSQAFDTVLVGAGYSPTGYTAISSNGIAYLDGVHDRYASIGFFRSEERRKASGYEHSLMTTGNYIKALAAHNNISLVTAKQDSVFNFVSDSKKVSTSSEANGGTAVHTVLTYSSFQQIQLLYSKSENAYYRYQYGTKAHYDAETGTQLRFENVIILFAEQSKIEGDTEGRLSVQTEGSGTGYFLCGGRYIEINWSRKDKLSPFVFTDTNGKAIKMAAGKTFITVVDSAKKGTADIVLNYGVEEDTAVETGAQING